MIVGSKLGKIITAILISACCATGLAANPVDIGPQLTYYGGYFNVTRHWQNRVTTEYTNLTRINGDYAHHLTRNAWLCRTRNQRIQYDIQYRLDLSLSDEEMLSRLKQNRDWLESRDMLDMVDMLYLSDEPYGRGWSDSDVNRISRLVAQVFPELKQLVTLNMYGLPGHTLPDTVDLVGAFNYNIGGDPDKTYAAVMSDVETVVSAIRKAVVTHPMVWIAQAAHGPPGDSRRMPTPLQMKWQYQACVDLNRARPEMNIIGFQWWQLENTSGWVGIAEDYFSVYAEQIQAHRDIGRDAGFGTNTYTFIDLFEAQPHVGDGHADGSSINGVNGWVCDYRNTDGVWHYNTGVDRISTGATVEGMRASRTVGRTGEDGWISPLATEVVFASPSLGLAGTFERFLVIDVAGRLGSTTGQGPSRVSIHVRDADGIECLVLALNNGDGSRPQVTLPLTDAHGSVSLKPIGSENGRPFAVRLVLDARDGSLDILNLHSSVTLLASNLQCYPGAVASRPDRLLLRHITSPYSLFDLDAVQSFTNDSYPEPRAAR